MKSVREFLFVLGCGALGLICAASPAIADEGCGQGDCPEGYYCGVRDRCLGCVGCYYFGACGQDYDYGYTDCDVDHKYDPCWFNQIRTTECECQCIAQADICSPLSVMENVVGSLKSAIFEMPNFCYYRNNEGICYWEQECKTPVHPYCANNPNGQCEIDTEEETFEFTTTSYEWNVSDPTCKCYS